MRQTQRLCLVPPNVITFWSQILILIQLSCSHFKIVPTAKRKVEKQKFRMWNNSHCSSFFFQLIMSQFRILLFIERGRWYPSTRVNRQTLDRSTEPLWAQKWNSVKKNISRRQMYAKVVSYCMQGKVEQTEKNVERAAWNLRLQQGPESSVITNRKTYPVKTQLEFLKDNTPGSIVKQWNHGSSNSSSGSEYWTDTNSLPLGREEGGEKNTTNKIDFICVS